MNVMARVFGVSLCVVFFVAACSSSDAGYEPRETEWIEEDAGVEASESSDAGFAEDVDEDDPVKMVVVTEEELLEAMQDEVAVAAGKEAFNAFNSCASCHGANGSGAYGPALDDGEWIHGGSPMEIYEVIRDGVPEEGMPGHGELDAAVLVGLTAYLASL